MTKRDLAHLAAFLILLVLLWRLGSTRIVTLAAATKTLEKVAAQQAEIDQLHREIERLESELQTERQWRDNTRERVQKLEVENERGSVHEGDNRRNGGSGDGDRRRERPEG